jgi:glycerol-3-phosphate dehydrogenase
LTRQRVYDVIIIGGGIIGLFISYYLSRTNVSVLLIEKNIELGLGVSKAHAGVIHVIQLPFKSLKSRLARYGNKLYDDICKTLGVKLNRVSALIVADRWIHFLAMPFIYLYLKLSIGKEFPIKIILRREKLESYEKNIGKGVLSAIVVGGYGVVDSFDLLYSLYRFARVNGVNFKLGIPVNRIEINQDYIRVVCDGETYKGEFVVNAAGLDANNLAAITGDEEEIEYGKGAMIVYPFKYAKSLISPLSIKQDPKTKGGAIIPLVNDKTILGPNLTMNVSKEDVSVSEEDIRTLIGKFSRLIKSDLDQPIKVYAGVRPIARVDDFIIKYSSRTDRLIHLLGIASPGLTAAPAIAKKVICMLEDVGLKAEEKEEIKYDKPLYLVERLREGLHINPDDHILCPYSLVSEEDIKQAVRDGAKTIQGLMFRTRLGFNGYILSSGYWRAIKLLAKELGIPIEDITLKGDGSWIVKKY